MAVALVVGDNPQHAAQVSGLLTAAGHTPHAATAADAVAAVGRMLPDVVIADLGATDPAGLDLVREVRRKHPLVPVLAVTEVGSEERAVAALKAGAASYLPRRNLARDLPGMLDDLLSVARSQQKRVLFLQRMAAVEYTFELESDPDLVANLVSQVELVMEQMRLFDDADRMRVGVGVHEAAVNAIVHGNLEVGSELKRDDWAAYHQRIADRRRQPPYRDRRVTVAVRAVRGRELGIRIADQGPGFDPSKLPDPTDPANLATDGGRGMLLIRTFFDEVRHNPAGNEITLVKRV